MTQPVEGEGESTWTRLRRRKVVHIAEIARRLNVAHLVEGSVRTSGNKVRVTAQLIRARSRRHCKSA